MLKNLTNLVTLRTLFLRVMASLLYMFLRSLYTTLKSIMLKAEHLYIYVSRIVSLKQMINTEHKGVKTGTKL